MSSLKLISELPNSKNTKPIDFHFIAKGQRWYKLINPYVDKYSLTIQGE